MIKKELRFTDCPTYAKGKDIFEFRLYIRETGRGHYGVKLNARLSYVLRIYHKFKNIFHTRSKNVINGSENNYDCRLVIFAYIYIKERYSSDWCVKFHI